ncbi:MAG: nitroreductase [Acidobacteriota bacterium]
MSEHFKPRITPWYIDDGEFYELESFDEQMRFLLQYAVLAPSGHNTQPWAFRTTPEGVEVFADYSKRLLIVDPQDRELYMSIGAAITNFRVAAAHFGFETTVLYDRQPEERIPVALITAVETCGPDENLTTLFRAIRKRHTNRAPFDGEPIDPSALSRVCDMTERFPDTLRLILPHDKPRVADMIEEASRMQMARPAFRAEIADWVFPDDDEHTDGLRADALGVPPLLTGSATWFLRQFDSGAWQAPRDRRLAESAAGLLLVTADDDRVSLLRAGEALELLLLTIADVGLQYSFLNQPVTVNEMRERLRTLAGASNSPQLLIRIGTAPPVEHAMPRRPLDRVVGPSSGKG